jgi:hypothetical protein
MITNTGKSIIAKYLIGDTPAYASYVAVGCGAAPIDTGIKSGVSTATLSGTISSTTLATQVTGLSSDGYKNFGYRSFWWRYNNN